MKIFITAIGTDCGKTLVSAIFCQALKADYWKPVQTGEVSDSEEILKLTQYSVNIFKEAYKLLNPVSPHLAAKLENKTIELEGFRFPETDNHIIIEGAGGILVPLNDKGDFFIDYIAHQNIETVLVIRLYLGCINHSLLSINELKNRKVKIKGLIFNGNDTFGAIDIITSLSRISSILHIQEEEIIDQDTVLKYSQLLKI